MLENYQQAKLLSMMVDFLRQKWTTILFSVPEAYAPCSYQGKFLNGMESV
jgi:hypothetical protein